MVKLQAFHILESLLSHRLSILKVLPDLEEVVLAVGQACHTVEVEPGEEFAVDMPGLEAFEAGVGGSNEPALAGAVHTVSQPNGAQDQGLHSD